MKSTVALLAVLFTSPALALAQFGEAGPAQPSAGSRPQSGDEQALREMDRRLLEAVIKGDRSFFESLLTDDAIITDRNGRVTTKAEALKTFQPLPDLKFALTREDVRVHIHGDAAVLSARSVGTVQAGSQTIKVDERTTDMYARLGGRWRLVAGHTSDIPAERTAAKIEAKIYDQYSRGVSAQPFGDIADHERGRQADDAGDEPRQALGVEERTPPIVGDDVLHSGPGRGDGLRPGWRGPGHPLGHPRERAGDSGHQGQMTDLMHKRLGETRNES